jgi:hypothetical protein
MQRAGPGVPIQKAKETAKERAAGFGLGAAMS